MGNYSTPLGAFITPLLRETCTQNGTKLSERLCSCGRSHHSYSNVCPCLLEASTATLRLTLASPVSEVVGFCTEVEYCHAVEARPVVSAGVTLSLHAAAVPLTLNPAPDLSTAVDSGLKAGRFRSIRVVNRGRSRLKGRSIRVDSA